jgi:hypothetical protein
MTSIRRRSGSLIAGNNRAWLTGPLVTACAVTWDFVVGVAGFEPPASSSRTTQTFE